MTTPVNFLYASRAYPSVMVPSMYAIVAVAAVQSQFDLAALVATDGAQYDLRGKMVQFAARAGNVTFLRAPNTVILTAGVGNVLNNGLQTLPFWVDSDMVAGGRGTIVQVIGAGACSLDVLWSPDAVYS